MNQRLPDPLPLKQHLDSSTTAELEEFLRFWSPHEKPRNGRAKLVEDLYRLMSDENVVYAKIDLLSEKVRLVLMSLLRATHYTSDLGSLLRGLDSLELEHYEAEAALTALSRRGFVRISRGQNMVSYGRSAYAIPRETARVMRGLAGADRRPLNQVFLHAGYKPANAAEAAEELVPVPPEDVVAVLAEVPDDLREIATRVIEEHGGILTRQEFVEIFGPRWDSGRFLAEYGGRGLGTVGHLDLRTKGLGVDDDALFFFHEVVECYAGQRRGEPPAYDTVLSAHGDLMSDVRATLEHVKESPVKVAKDGAVYKSARTRLGERLQFQRQPLLGRADVAAKTLSIVRGLQLAVRNDQSHLAVTERGEQWKGLPLGEKIEQAYNLLFSDEVQTLRSHHLRGVHEIVVELLKAHDGWFAGQSLALLARNRYLLDLVVDDSPPHRVPLAVTDAALTELGRAAHDVVLRDLFALGLIEVAVRGDEAVGVRLAPLGRRLWLGQEPAVEAKPLVVNPDFELLVLPEGDVDDLLHALDRIAVRERTGEVVHYKLDRRRIERVTAAGESLAEWIEFLQRHSRTEIPQNVVYSLGSWGDTVRSAQLARGWLLQVDDATVVQAVLGHPLLKTWVVSVVGDTALLLCDDVSERQVVSELRSMGVYVR